MNPNKRPPPSSSAETFEGGDATKRARDHPEKILRPGQEQPGNVLLVRVTDIVHPVTILALQQIFSRFGKVDKIVMFDKGSGSQALVQMANVHSAMNAHEAADMQEMYSGCNLIRVGYSNLQNVTVKGNTERSWDFNIGPPLEGALPPGTTTAPMAATSAGASGYRGGPAASAPPVTHGSSNLPSSTPHRHAPQQSYSPQQYSPYSAAQQPQPTPYAPPPQHQAYTPPQQSYGAPSAQSAYSPQQQQQQQQQQQPRHQPYGNVMPSGGGGTYAPPSFIQQGFAPPYGQAPPPPFSQQPYIPQPFGQQSYTNRGGGRGGSSDDNSITSGAGGSNGVGPGGSGSFSRPPPPQTSSYYPSPANIIPSPQSGPYGGIPFSSERSTGAGGFGSMGMGGGAARPIPHSGRPGRGGGAGGPGAGGPGGGGGGGQGRAAAGRGPPLSVGGGGSGLLQPPMHRQGPVPLHDNGNYRPQMRFRSSDKKSTTNTAPGGAIKSRSRVPRLDPIQIQALRAAAVIAKKSARQPTPEEVLEGIESSKGTAVAGGGRSRAIVGGNGKTLPGFVKEGGGTKGASGNKNANKREAAEMLGPDATEQLAAATAKVFLGKRTNKREASEMLGPDTTDQLAAATAKVRVSDDGDHGEGDVTDTALSTEIEKEVEEGGGSEKAGIRQEESDSKRKACAVAGDEEGDNGSGKRAAGVDGVGCVGDDAAVEGVVTRRGGLRSGGRQGKAKLSQGEKITAGDVDVAEGQDPYTCPEVVQEKVEGAAKADGASSRAEGRAKTERGEKAEDGIKGIGGQDDTESETNGEAKEEKLEAGDESDGKSRGGEVADSEKEGEGEGEGDVGDGAEREAKGKGEEAEGEGDGNDDDDEDGEDGGDAAGEGEAERVDVGAWAAAAPALRSPIVMVRHVDTLEVSPGSLCHLFGLYGDVMKVKLVASRGMALVQMRYPVQAVNAQRLLDQTPLSGMTLEVKASSQWTINDPTATDFSVVEGLHRFSTTPSPEDKRYRDSLSPPCSTLVVDNVSPDVSAEALTAIFSKHGAVSSVDLDTNAQAPLDAVSALPSSGGSNSEPTKPSVQALVHMEADGKVRATEAAVHALIMTHNLTLAERRLRVSFLSGKLHVEK